MGNANHEKSLSNIINQKYYLLFFLLYLTVLLGLHFNEDNLGGAITDALIILKYQKNLIKIFINIFKVWKFR